MKRRIKKEDKSADRRVVNDAKDARDKTAAIAKKNTKGKISEKVAYTNKVVGDSRVRSNEEQNQKCGCSEKQNDCRNKGFKRLKSQD